MAGKLGFCRAGGEAELFQYAPHNGEEPAISGDRGSGTVFFSRCTMSCIYCQNYPWSQEGSGIKMTTDTLAMALGKLRECKCHNWNLVSPTPWLPMICEALEKTKKDGKPLPVVYNTSGYERVEILKTLETIVDIYLADLRYARASTAACGSNAGNYVENARKALKEMWRQKGALQVNAEGIARAGVICRILILPGFADEACMNLRWLAENLGTNVYLSIMAQYLPAYKARSLSPWNRTITSEEYKLVCREAETIGFTEGWIQDFSGNINPELVGFNMPAVKLAGLQNVS